jgi:methanogenic corrinoid protein MtbC1
VYSISAAPRLRRIVQAIAMGHRAAHVIPLESSALDSLLDQAAAGPLTGPELAAVTRRSAGPGRHVSVGRTSLRALLRATREMDEPALQSLLEAAAARLDPLAFIEQVARPLMREVGRAWESGRLDVRHEHFASARLADVLRQMRRRVARTPGRPRAVLASLPGDSHELGLLMAALVFTAEGWQVTYMGRDTPVDQLVALAQEVELDCVALGISDTVPAADARRAIAALRKSLPEGLPLVVGGAGAPAGAPGITRIADARSLRDWLEHRPARH